MVTKADPFLLLCSRQPAEIHAADKAGAGWPHPRYSYIAATFSLAIYSKAVNRRGGLKVPRLTRLVFPEHRSALRTFHRAKICISPAIINITIRGLFYFQGHATPSALFPCASYRCYFPLAPPPLVRLWALSVPTTGLCLGRPGRHRQAGGEAWARRCAWLCWRAGGRARGGTGRGGW